MCKLQKLPEAELLAMQIVWRIGENADSDLIVADFVQEKNWERPAILTVLKRLEGKGFLNSTKIRRRNAYTPLVSEKAYLEFESKSFLEKMCGNSVKKLVAALYSSHALSETDLEELKNFIEEAK